MDISDQHLQQAVATSSHGPVSHALLPLNYMHNLQSVDNHSPLIPSYTLVQPPLIISSSSLGEHKAALNHFSANYRAAAPISSSGLAFSAGNMSINPNNSGSDQYIPGKSETFDYGFNQIYNDQLQFFEMPGNNPHERAHSTEQSKDTQKLMPHETAKTPTELNSAAGPFPSQAGQTSSGDVLKSEPDEDSFAPISTHRSSASGYPFASNGSFLHSLVDMESLKEEAYSNDARGGADFEHEPRMPSTSSTPADYHCHHLLDFSNFTSFPAQEMTDSHQSHKGTALNTIHEKRPTSSNSKVAAGTESGVAIGIAHARGKAQTAPKRRKSQQKRVVCVPAMGGVERPTGECVPSDSWAWRKYGQKPIKNSPYPRSYYKCSSVKGCTARKQVERNPSDPMMIIITYTVEHSHPASSSPKPAQSEGDDKQIETDDTQININDAAHTSKMVGVQDGADAMSEESGEPISSEGNLNDINNKEAMISESDYQKVEQQQQQQQVQDSTVIGVEEHVGLLSSTSPTSCSSSLYPFGNLKSRSSKADDDFFAQLGELPDLFGKNSVWPGPQCDHHNQSSAVTASSSAAHDTGSIPLSTHINIDPFDLYYWP